MSAPLDEMLILLRRIADGIERLTPAHEPESTRLTKKEVAAWLDVSTRWVERHLVPTERIGGGKSWYVRADVEAQLARLRRPASARLPRSAHTAPPRRKGPRRPPTNDMREHSTVLRVAEIEQRLRHGRESSKDR